MTAFRATRATDAPRLLTSELHPVPAVPSFDNALLVAGNSVHSILEPLMTVASFTDPDGCDPGGEGTGKR